MSTSDVTPLTASRGLWMLDGGELSSAGTWQTQKEKEKQKVSPTRLQRWFIFTCSVQRPALNLCEGRRSVTQPDAWVSLKDLEAPFIWKRSETPNMGMHAFSAEGDGKLTYENVYISNMNRVVGSCPVLKHDGRFPSPRRPACPCSAAVKVRGQTVLQHPRAAERSRAGECAAIQTVCMTYVLSSPGYNRCIRLKWCHVLNSPDSSTCSLHAWSSYTLYWWLLIRYLVVLLFFVKVPSASVIFRWTPHDLMSDKLCMVANGQKISFFFFFFLFSSRLSSVMSYTYEVCQFKVN